MKRLAALAFACLVGAAPSVLAANTASPALKAGVFEPARAAPEFSLRGSDGNELKLSRYRGKLVLLAFGFTDCPSVCPITLSVLAEARKALGADAADVQVIFVTVDPERDDPAQMRKYLANFDRTFIGGTGTPAQLAAVRKDYGVAATKLAQASGYGIDHSSFVYLVGRDGRLRALMPFGHKPADYVHDVKLLLRQ